MKNILILGAGQSAPYLISYLLNEAKKNDWYVTVCDMNLDLAESRIKGHPNGKALKFDVNDEEMRNTQIKNSDIVVNFLAPRFQYMIALDCLLFGKHVITASYEHPNIADLGNDAQKKGILILNEMGLDPGIDHMSALKVIHDIREEGGHIKSFVSYGSGIPAPEVKSNPLDYCITWNPRNIAMAGESGAQYMEKGKIKILSNKAIFQRTWDVEIDGIGRLEAYPNRDSLVYIDMFELNYVKTMIRGTLRYPGWSETWNQIVKLGMPNETMKIPGLAGMTYAQYTEMFLPLNSSGTRLESRVAGYLGISPTGNILNNLRYLGLFGNEKIGGNVRTSTDVLVKLLNDKMPLPDGARDVVILQHEIVAQYTDKGNTREKIISTLIEYGEPDGFTAISRTVGLPAAIAAKLVMTGKLKVTGCHIPINREIYKPVLDELEREGIKFVEKKEKL
jgi:saccharopine dehydrogenase (NADP+, L-glutamate forming)